MDPRSLPRRVVDSQAARGRASPRLVGFAAGARAGDVANGIQGVGRRGLGARGASKVFFGVFVLLLCKKQKNLQNIKT